MQTTEASPVVDSASASAIPNPESTIGNYGNSGRFAGFKKSVFNQLQTHFSLSPSVADKIARDAASDIGKAMVNGQATIKLGKVSEDGKVSISDTTKIKTVAMTNNIAIVRALQYINDAGKNGVSYQNTKWCLTPVLAKYVAEIEAEITAELVKAKAEAKPETETKLEAK